MSAFLALKVDVDTYAGTVDGVPRLLALFAKEGVRATFFFSLGPDTTGKAVKRVFRKGFVKKVLRASPVASYGIRTMLYGTLLPAPDIGRKADAVRAMREAKSAGHELGIHAWDHVDWHDRLAAMDRAEVERTVTASHARFAEIFGESAALSAAPGWTATPASVEVQEAHGIRVTSDTRGGAPFHPLRADGTPSRVIEVPSTLPTLDELLAWDRFASAREGTIAYLKGAVVGAPGAHVHSIHTEIEGGKALHALFAKQLGAWKESGVELVTVGDVASRASAAGPLPARALGWTVLPGRAIRVATGIAAP